MADAISVSAPISGTDRTMSFEAGKLAQLADGAVVARIGDTVLLATATAARSVREGTDFFPLTVDIEERAYAAGKIPGSFFRREGKASDQAILTCRLIDRPLRPSFPKGFRNEVHVVGTIFGADQVNPHDVLAINAASAALMLSGIPFDGPIGAVRIAYSTEGTWIPHPTYQEGDESTFELVVAGRALSEGADAEIAIMMVEAGGTERSWEYYEDGRAQGHRGGAGRGPRGGQDLDPRVDQPPAPAGGGRTSPPAARSRPSPSRPSRDYGDDVWRAGRRRSARDADRQGQRHHRPRPSATRRIDAPTTEIVAALADEFPERPGEIKAAVRGAHQEAGAPAHRRGGRAHRRPGHEPTSGRSRPRWTSSRRPTARRSSSGARPRCST